MADLKALLQKGHKLDWVTPYPLFKELDDEFHFELDAATCKHNLMNTPYYYTEEQDGLKQPWRNPTWVNPPYSARNITKWLEKAYNEWWDWGITSVFLLPARTDTHWFHKYIWSISHPRIAREVRFVEGRLSFGVCKHCYPDFEPRRGNTFSAPFNSMIVVFRG